MKPFFSVIIPALNEEYYIGKVLKALTQQTFKDFEVVVVDAKSTDKTVKVVDGFKDKLPLKIVSTPHRNISLSRNEGASHANSSYYVFIDADNSMQPDFLEKVKKLIDGKKYDMLIPSVIPDSKEIVYKIIYSFMNNLVFIAKSLNIAFSTGGNLIIENSKFKQLKGFNEKIFVGEDHEIVRRAEKMKMKITFMRDVHVIFSVRRLQKEKFSLVLKYVKATVYIVLFGKITKKIYNYPMGGQYFAKKLKSK